MGAFSEINNPKSLSLPLAFQPIKGDEIVIELFEPLGNDTSICIIGKINHDFLGYYSGTGFYGYSCTDQVDVMCSEGDNWRKEINSVCYLIINGFSACSAALINNTQEDGKPYILTANHCYESIPIGEERNNAVAATIAVFNYESPSCNGPDDPFVDVVSGMSFRANWIETDFFLLEANTQIPTSYNTYYSGWDRRGLQPQNGVGIHHPWIDVKKICTHSQTPVSSNCMGMAGSHFYINTNFWEINPWDITPNGNSRPQPGSSGSPLYNSNKRIIGQLFGPVNCFQNYCFNRYDEGQPIPVSDYSNYGKLEISWDGNGTSSTRLKDWLHPSLLIAPDEFLGLRFVRFYTITHDERYTGDVVKFHDVNILGGNSVVVTELQDRFEATGFLNIPTGVAFDAY